METTKKIMECMTVRQLRTLKDDCVDLWTWLEAVAALADAMGDRTNGHDND